MKKKGILAVAVLLFTLVLSSCGTKSPTDTATEFITLFQAGETNKISEVYSGSIDLSFGDSTLFNEDVMKLIRARMVDFDYTITDEQMLSDTTASVSMDITAHTMGDATIAAMQTIVSDASDMALNDASEEEIMAAAVRTYQAALGETTKSYTASVDLTLTKTGSKWMVDDLDTNFDFGNAILGNLLTISNVLAGGTEEGGTQEDSTQEGE